MDILMPQLGETVAEGTVTTWYKQIGDAVKADEALFDVETDKVSTEIPSPVSGVLTEVLVPAGKTVKVGTRLAVVRPAGERTDASSETRGAALAPPIGAAGAASVSGKDAPGAAQGADSRVRGSDAGASWRGSEAPGIGGRGSEARATPSIAPAQAGDPGVRDPRQKLSPVVRRLLAEHGIEAHEVRGTGRDGRVMREDVLNHVAAAARAPVRAPSAAAAALAPAQDAGRDAEGKAGALPSAQPRAVPSVAGAGAPALAEGERVVTLNTIRRRSGAAMARAWQQVPHVLQAVEADYSRIEQARTAKQAAWQAREGFELTYLPFLAFAVCQALARYEQLNARLDGDDLVVSRRVHLGIAVDLNHDGLVVPVVRDAQDRNVPALAREIRRLALGARANRLKPDDFAQPTYTLSNSGVFGTLITAPLVNPPQVAILSTDGVRKRPVVVESADGDTIAVRPVGVLAQSFDHRAVDGAYSAAFLKEIKRIVETRAWVEDVV
jgi:2-oxoglutarate dehydrogenase E2 component (dihydrolipoamide succinyltransferase)